MKHPEPRLEITIRDWCPVKDQPLYISEHMEVSHFQDLKNPGMVLIETVKQLQKMIKFQKEQTQKRQLEEHREKLMNQLENIELSLDKLTK